MKNLLLLSLMLASTFGYSQVVSFGYSGGGDLPGGMLGYNTTGGFGGEIHIKGNSMDYGYIGLLGTYEFLDEDDFNIEIGGGIEAQQKYKRSDDINFQFGQTKVLESIRYSPYAKITARWNFIEAGVNYGASGLGFQAGFILNR